MYLLFIGARRNLGIEEAPYGGVDDFVHCDLTSPTVELIRKLVVENAYRFSYVTDADELKKEGLETTRICVVGMLHVISAVHSHVKRYASEVYLEDGVLRVHDTVPDNTNDGVDDKEWHYRHIPCLEALASPPQPVESYRIFYQRATGEKYYFKYGTPCLWVQESEKVTSTWSPTPSKSMLELARIMHPCADYEREVDVSMPLANVHPDNR